MTSLTEGSLLCSKNNSRIDFRWSSIQFLLALLPTLAFALGATDEETALAMPGDEVIKPTSFNLTRAITIHTRPEEIWRGLYRLGSVALVSTATICWTIWGGRALIVSSWNSNRLGWGHGSRCQER